MEQQLYTESISDSNSQTFDPQQNTGVASFQLHLDCFPSGETFKEDIEVPNYINYEADSLLQLPNNCGCNCGNCCSNQNCTCNGNRQQQSDPNLIENFSELIDDLTSFQAYAEDLDILEQSNQPQNILCFCSKLHANANNENGFLYSGGFPNANQTTTATNNANDGTNFVSGDNENKCCLIIDLNTLKQL